MKVLDLLCEESKKAIKKQDTFLWKWRKCCGCTTLSDREVVKYKKRKALPALALTTDTSILTAVGNDYNFKNIFSRQIEAIGKREI